MRTQEFMRIKHKPTAPYMRWALGWYALCLISVLLATLLYDSSHVILSFIGLTVVIGSAIAGNMFLKMYDDTTPLALKYRDIRENQDTLWGMKIGLLCVFTIYLTLIIMYCYFRYTLWS